MDDPIDDITIFPTCCVNCGVGEVPLYHFANESDDYCWACIQQQKEKIVTEAKKVYRESKYQKDYVPQF